MAGASKRGKPSYFMSILGVTLVLFVLGIIGWLVINSRELANHFKENVEVNVFLREPLLAEDSAAAVNYLAAQPYVKKHVFTTKEMARKKYLEDGNEDWKDVLDQNPLPPSIDFKLKKQYVDTSHLKIIKTNWLHKPYVSEVKYPASLVGNMDANFRKISLIMLGIAVLLAVVVIFLIDNTIRLAMFSNRFTIKTMQMVGATRWFIIKPLDVRAIVNGAISGLLAIGGVYGIMMLAEKYVP